MRILEKLFLGKINGAEHKLNLNKEKQEKEYELYELLLSKLTAEDKHIVDKFAEACLDNMVAECTEQYILGFKTGLLICVESAYDDL